MRSLLYDAVAINKTDVIDLLIELCRWVHICAHRTDVRSSLVNHYQTPKKTFKALSR